MKTEKERKTTHPWQEMISSALFKGCVMRKRSHIRLSAEKLVHEKQLILLKLTSCKHINALSQFLPVVDLEEGHSPPPNFWVKLRPTRPRKIFSRQAGSEFTQPSYLQLLTDLTLRGPYSFFLRVVSWARKPDGILAWLQVGLPRQNCRIIKEW